MLRYSLFISSLLCLWSFSVQAQRDPNMSQNITLAREYYSNGEYEKAAELYKVIHENNRAHEYFYERYLATLLELQDYKAAEDMLKKSIKASPEKLERLVDYGNLFELTTQPAKAQEQYEKAVKGITDDEVQITKLASAFLNRKKYDFAIQTYEKGGKLLKKMGFFSYELGGIYYSKGDVPKTIEAYLDALEHQPNRLTNIQAFFQKDLAAAGGYEELKKQLYARTQKNPNQILYPELLMWLAMQEGDYVTALRQAKGLDKRFQENGERVYKLAISAIDDKKYDEGIEAYEYVVTEKGKESAYYLNAKQNLLAAKRNRLTAGFQYQKSDLEGLEKDYESFLDEFGRTRPTADIMRELADFEAKYINNLDKAIAILEEVIKIPQLSRNTQAQAKLDLGDYYLMKGEHWEATLLYSQVDKELKDAPLGTAARFKNAKLSYYKADFEWTQNQLDILKGSTSELISNDAIDLSVFIMAHYDLDTTHNAMRLFAEADLLTFQNKDDLALKTLDTVGILYKGHGLEDDILYRRAEIAFKHREYDKGIKYLQELVETQKEGIWVDNALFKMAELYETRLNDPKKAMELYDKIIIDHSGSLLVVDARKRFRALRGDNMP